MDAKDTTTPSGINALTQAMGRRAGKECDHDWSPWRVLSGGRKRKTCSRCLETRWYARKNPNPPYRPRRKRDPSPWRTAPVSVW